MAETRASIEIAQFPGNQHLLQSTGERVLAQLVAIDAGELEVQPPLSEAERDEFHQAATYLTAK